MLIVLDTSIATRSCLRTFDFANERFACCRSPVANKSSLSLRLRDNIFFLMSGNRFSEAAPRNNRVSKGDQKLNSFAIAIVCDERYDAQK